MSRAGYTQTCEVCGKTFRTRRPAKTCSIKCRTAKSRGKRTGKARGWFAVRAEFQDMATQLSHVAPQETMDCLATILYDYGAIPAEYAIVAVARAVGLQVA